jgi:mono/diheme cytochrome c family protein
MISARMNRPFKVLLVVSAATAVALFAAACGTQKIQVSSANATLHRGAQLFNQRCAGCHTLSYAATNGSAANVRTREITNGPNFDVRCERPVTRVLYAIENGGFSGAIMPQNIVVGQDARAVAQFVSTYAGRQAQNVPGATKCVQKPVGTLPPLGVTTTTSSSAPALSASATTTSSSQTSKPAGTGKKKKK